MMMMVLVVMIITGDDVAVNAGDSGEHVVDNGVADARGDYNGDNDVVVDDGGVDDDHGGDADNVGVGDHDDADGDDDDDEDDDGVRYLSLLGFAVVASSLSTPPPSSPSCC